MTNLFTCLSNWKLKYICALAVLLCLGVGNAWGAVETLTMSAMGWSNSATPSSITSTPTTITLAKNSAGTTPTFYTSDNTLRLYGVKNKTTGCSIQFTAKTGITLTSITFSYTIANSGVLSASTGSYNTSTKVWTGTLTAGNSVKFTTTNTGTVNSNPQVKITEIVITYLTNVTLNKNEGSENGAVIFDHNATSYKTSSFTPVTRSNYTCTGYWTATSGGTQILDAEGAFAATNVTVSSTEYIKSSKWVYAGATLTLYAQWVSAGPACADPTAPGNSSISATGATITFSESGNYDIYYNTSSTAPTGSTAATTTVSSASSKALTGLAYGTKYYYWARKDCGEGSKSDYVAGATPGYFTTLASNPTSISAGSTTPYGTTFTITDSNSPASYDIIYKTNSTTPAANADVTTTSTSKTKAITGLTPNTTYYYWVRGVGPDAKSSWVSGGSFTTPAITAISVNTAPTKTTYFAGETFDPTGLKITASYSSTSMVIPYAGNTALFSFSPTTATALTTSDDAVTITLAGQTVDQTINVYSVTVNKVNEDGDAIGAAGVTATWTVGTKALAAGVSTTNYVFKNWEFDGSNNGLSISSTTSSSTTVSGTPTGNVTIKAVFYKPIVISWTKGGTTYSTGSPTDEVKRGTQWKDLTIPTAPGDASLGACADKFMGWTNASHMIGTGHSAPGVLFTSVSGITTEITEPIEFKAVFATGSESSTSFVKLGDDEDSYLVAGAKIAIVNNKDDKILNSNFSVTAATHPGSDDNKLTVSSGQVWTLIEQDEYDYWKVKCGDVQLGTSEVVTSSGSTDIGNYTNDYSWWVFSSNTEWTQKVSGCYYMYNWYDDEDEYFNFLEYNGTKWVSYYNTGITSGAKAWYAMKLYKPGITYSDYVTKCCTPLGYIGGSVEFTDPTTAVLTWNAMSNVDGTTPYTITYRTGSDAFDDDNVGSISTNGAGKKTCTITGLSCNTSYDFKIAVTAATNYCDKDSTMSGKNSGKWDLDYTFSGAALKDGDLDEGTGVLCGDLDITIEPLSVAYELPSDVTVTIGGDTKTKGTEYTWDSSTGELSIDDSYIDGDVTVTCTATLVGCTSDPTIGAVSLSGTFNLGTVGVTVGTSSTGSATCAWTDYGFVWSESANPTVGGSGCTKVAVGSDGSATTWNGSLTKTSFATGTTYYYRAYGKNSKTSAAFAYSSSDGTFKPQSVTFNSNGGSSVDTKYVNNGSSVSAPTAPTKTGYTFDSWRTTSGLTTEMNFSGTITKDTTLYAKWTANSYTVTLDNNNATTGSSQTVSATYDAAMPSKTTADGTPAVAALSRTGYTFTGWWDATSGGKQYYSYNAGTSTLSSANNWDKTSATTLKAQWSANNYTITLDNEGADSGKEGSANISVTYDATTNLTGTPAITKPVKDGYLFDGYFLGDNGTGTQIIDADGDVIASVASYTSATKQWIYAGSITLHAKWIPIYTVTWKVNGEEYSTGVVTGNSQVPDGEKISACPTAPADNTLSCSSKFMGWSVTNIPAGSPVNGSSNISALGLFTDRAGSPTITKDTVFYAVFAKQTNSNGYKYIGDDGTLADGKKYIFVSSKSAGNTKALKATDLPSVSNGTLGTAVDVTVTSNAEGVLVTTVNTDLEFEYVSTGTKLKYVVSGPATRYLFVNGSGVGYKSDDSRSRYTTDGLQGWNNAVSKYYDVYYDGSTGYTKAESAGSRVYAFIKQTPVYGDYRVQCDPNIVTVTYDANSGATTCSDEETNKTEDYTVCSSAPTRDYYTFAGWLCSADSKTYAASATIDDGAIDDDFTLTAQWTPVSYSISYNLNGGTNPADPISAYNVETTSALPTPTKGHDRFDGWYTDDGVWSNQVASITAGMHGNLTLYAKWTSRYEIVFDVYGGSTTTIYRAADENLESAVAEQGSKPSDPDAPSTCSTKTFVGWVESEIDDETDTKPASLTNATGTPTADKHYYATWALKSGSDIDAVEDNSFSSKDENGSYGSSTFSFKAENKYLQQQSIWDSDDMKTGTKVKIRVYHFSNNTADVLRISLINSSGTEVTGADLNTSKLGSNISSGGWSDYVELTPTTAVTGYKVSMKTLNSNGTGINKIEREVVATYSKYATSCCATKVTLSQNSPSNGTIVFGKSTIQTCDEDKTVKMTITPAPGYQLHTYSVATGDGKVATKSMSAEVDLDNNSSDAQEIDLTFAQDANGAYNVTASFSLMTVTSWAWTLNSAAIPDPLNLYVGQTARFDVAYTPSGVDNSKKTYTRNKVDAYINWSGGKQATYSTIEGRASTGDNTTAVTFTHADGPETVVNVKVKPLPLVHFKDNVHGVAFDDVVATLTANALTDDGIANTPTHDDFDGSTANTCEEQHLHLVGWIDGAWPAYAAYMAGTGDKPSESAIVGATGYFYLPGAEIDLVAKDGHTYYAIWAKVE